MNQKSSLSAFAQIEIIIRPRRHQPGTQTKIGDFFYDCGIGPHELAFFERNNRSHVAVYTRSRKTAEKIKSRFARELGKDFFLETRVLERGDWFDKWQLDYQMMPLSKTFMLVPLWQKEKFKGGRIPVYLDPKGASGSGQHPTTQIMAALMEEAVKQGARFSSFLDLGTGTGVLCVAAAHFGAKTILAVDYDPVAVTSARFNLRLNRVRGRVIRKDVKALESEAPRDVICANLVSALLMDIRKYLFSNVRRGGYLIVSGIYLSNLKAFRAQFRHKKFECLRVMKKRGWGGLLFRRL